jgi:hypothetical protein
MPEGKNGHCKVRKHAQLVSNKISLVTKRQPGKPPMAHTNQGGAEEADWLCGFSRISCFQIRDYEHSVLVITKGRALLAIE